jgi:hypothetical protein
MNEFSDVRAFRHGGMARLLGRGAGRRVLKLEVLDRNQCEVCRVVPGVD